MSKTIIITGTASGIGRATVTKFAAEGWNVVATVRKQADLETHAGLHCVKTLLLDVDYQICGEPPTAGRSPSRRWGRWAPTVCCIAVTP